VDDLTGAHNSGKAAKGRLEAIFTALCPSGHRAVLCFAALKVSSRKESMVRFQFKLGPLSGEKILHDDQHHKLVVNDRVLPLSPKEYKLVIALLHQRQKWQESEEQASILLSIGQLQKLTGILSQASLQRHLSNAAVKLAPLGILVVNVRSYGYLILFDSEVTEAIR
jgi:DNA-binding response OmpR family regulator